MNKKENDITYYAIAGLNGYGVYTDLVESQKASDYIFDCKCRKFKNLNTAKHWATERLYALQPPYRMFPGIDRIEKLNWSYYRKKY